MSELQKFEWTDPARDGRVVPVKIYKPNTPERAPVVLWSHGMGGTRDGAGFIARALAEAGMMIVNVQHDGTDDVLWRGKPGHPWDNIKAATVKNETLCARWRDISFVLDRLLEIYPDRIDADRIGYGGHSLGALSVQILCGQLWPDENGRLASFADPRIGHGLLYSPVPSLSTDHPTSVFETINRPILHMTGTNDVSPLSGYGYEERFRIFDNATAADRIMVVINGADHMVFAGSRGQLPGYPEIAAHEALIRDLSLCWWQNMFADETPGESYPLLKTLLEGQGTIDYRAGHATIAA